MRPPGPAAHPNPAPVAELRDDQGHERHTPERGEQCRPRCRPRDRRWPGLLCARPCGHVGDVAPISAGNACHPKKRLNYDRMHTGLHAPPLPAGAWLLKAGAAVADAQEPLRVHRGLSALYDCHASFNSTCSRIVGTCPRSGLCNGSASVHKFERHEKCQCENPHKCRRRTSLFLCLLERKLQMCIVGTQDAWGGKRISTDDVIVHSSLCLS